MLEVCFPKKKTTLWQSPETAYGDFFGPFASLVCCCGMFYHGYGSMYQCTRLSLYRRSALCFVAVTVIAGYGLVWPFEVHMYVTGLAAWSLWPGLMDSGR